MLGGALQVESLETDQYLLACTRYIDLKPVRARMAALPEDYSWSGYRTSAALAACEWIDPGPTYLAPGSSTEDRQRRHLTPWRMGSRSRNWPSQGAPEGF